MKKAIKKPVRDYLVDITFETMELRVKARTAGEARKKAIAKLSRRSLSGMVNRKQTFVDRI